MIKDQVNKYSGVKPLLCLTIFGLIAFASSSVLVTYAAGSEGCDCVVEIDNSTPIKPEIFSITMQGTPVGVANDTNFLQDNTLQACAGNSVSYTRDGETIGFEFNCDGGSCLCGKFANKWDYWVAPSSPGGKITITAMTPDAIGSGVSYRNGAQFGPTNMGSVNGFDGRSLSNRFGTYDSTKSLSIPLAVSPSQLGRPETIMKSISEDTLCTDSERICLSYVETLTLLDQPPGNVFRPAYFGQQKVMYSADTFDTSILSNVAPLSSTITWERAYELVQSVHPQHYVENQNLRQGYTAKINAQASDGYDGYYGMKIVHVLLKLTEEATGDDAALKDLTARGFTQLGIDLWAIHREGGLTNPTTGSYNFESAGCGAFTAQGGFNQNRLTPILFANALLGENWHVALNTTLATLNGKNCFGETGFIQPTSVTSSGKNVPLFGNMIGNHGIYNYTESSNCNIIASNYLTDGGYGSCGTPTPYQACCTHGHWLGSAMAIWLTPAVYNNFPANAMHWLDYVDRVRSTGVAVGKEFGSYSNPDNFDITGFDTGYDGPMYYESWNAYRECSKDQSCEGMP
ncbi:hypothetical protein KAR91_47635 [Candidatus Pacearchaeota archaeon]|nr:hypothetical protein [Candidatus Pacearchaeota archaeon]